ncbi:MAG: carboxynorspermidine decarboxylase [Lachnospiraceae bacterium]
MKFHELPTPCYVVDEKRLIHNLEILQGIMKRTGCHILLAQKAFAMFSVYPLVKSYLSGTTASGLYEAKLGFEEMGLENHIFSPAYREDEFEEICKLCGHIVFNSFSQLKKYKDIAMKNGVSIGIRVNPECSTQEGHEIYDPCASGSRLGVTLKNFQPEQLDGVEGIHFHTLCEQDADALLTTLDAVEDKFGPYLKNMKWINFGGGHHITKNGYDIASLEKAIKRIQKTYDVTVYIEPGEAIAYHAGYLVTSVLEIIENDLAIGILDTSAACHMPDVLEMPYRPPLKDAGRPGEKDYTYRLAGPTCLAGDVIGDYSFQSPLAVGERLIFEDMAIYSMVKNNTFNGMPLPAIAIQKTDGQCEIVKQFGYKDFKMRLS